MLEKLLRGVSRSFLILSGIKLLLDAPFLMLRDAGYEVQHYSGRAHRSARSVLYEMAMAEQFDALWHYIRPLIALLGVRIIMGADTSVPRETNNKMSPMGRFATLAISGLRV
jgi:hypothetical protein